ncbi:MAG: HEAT repeat domain-containing protein [Limnochordales bacterium]
MGSTTISASRQPASVAAATVSVQDAINAGHFDAELLGLAGAGLVIGFHFPTGVRAAAARKLGELGPQHAGLAVPALTGALSDPDEAVRSSAALSLGAFGAGAAPAVPALIEALGDPDDDVRSSAGIALEDIGPPARGALEGALGHANALIRAEAAILLRQLGADRGEP